MSVHDASAQTVDAKGIEFFERKIRPVLTEHCYRCHSAAARQNRKLKAKLLLDTEVMRQGGDSGPAVVAGKPQESLLLKALRHEGAEQMPPSGQLPAAVLTDFET